MNIKTEIIIIGAGPTGLSLANQLIRYGIDFIIVDKKETVTRLSKALVVHARSLEIYDQLGIAEKAVELGQIMNRFRVISDGKIRAEVPLTEIGKGLSPFPFALILEQSKNEEILYNLLQSKGKQVLWQTEIENLSQDSEGVKATLKKSDGEMFEVEAKYLVGCDGASSKTRHLLNLGFEGSTIPRSFYVADVEIETDLPRNMLSGVFGGDSFVLLMPMKGDKHWRLIGNLPEDSDGEKEISFEDVEEKVKSIVKLPLDFYKTHWFSSYKIHTRHAEKFSAGNCFLAGDACHVHTPAGGQGMNTGIQDAYNLAWKLAFVLKGFADKKLLETYNEERLANAIRLLKTTDEAFEAATQNEWYIRLFREKILPVMAKFALQFEAVKQFIFPTLSQIGISYHKHSLSRHNGDNSFKIKAGNRFPYFEIDGGNFFSQLNEPKFHYLTFDYNSDSAKIDAAIKTKYAKMVNFQKVPLYENIIEIFGTDKPFSVLIRPDNYIAFISEGHFAEEIEQYFAENVKRKDY